MGRKLEQDFAATIRSLAARNGRNAALAQEAVVESRSFTADEALAAHLIDLVAPSLPRLLIRALDGRVVEEGRGRGRAPHRRGAGRGASRCRRCAGCSAMVADPNIAYLLLTLG